MKIGRNSKCSCGSGKKYKKCCLNKSSTRIPPEVEIELKRKITKMNAEKEALKNAGIYINYVNPVVHQGKKVWALGSRIYMNNKPNQTFHEFIIEMLQQQLGKPWWDEELEKQEPHFIMRCFKAYHVWKKENAKDTNKLGEVWNAQPTGLVRSLVALAFDVCSLIHTMQLPDHLINRLRNRDQYQGARYEIQIAAVFARLGCDIEFLDDVEQKVKHCEFIAKHKDSGQVIAVEAKSRHRKGVIHMEGAQDKMKNLKGDVHKLLNKALKQRPDDKPFIICIDLNSPYADEAEFERKKWVKDIMKFMKTYGQPSPKNPDPYTAIFFTNFSPHYQAEVLSAPAEHLAIIPLHAEFPLLNPDMLFMLQTALNNCGNVPNITADD